MTIQVIEIDTMTGFERDLPNYTGAEWTRESAEEAVAFRRAIITARYDYRIEDDAETPREPLHGDDMPRPDDMPDLPMPGDRW